MLIGLEIDHRRSVAHAQSLDRTASIVVRMDRIERHDFVNAALLAIVLLAMAFALVVATRALFNALDEESIVTAETTPETTTTTTAPQVTVGEEVAEETSSTQPPRAPNEVTVRVGNGAGKSGVAGRATTILANASYVTLGAKNSSVRLATTAVYYVEGYGADAEVIATLLNVPITNIAPMPPEPGIAIDSANVVVILGADTSV